MSALRRATAPLLAAALMLTTGGVMAAERQAPWDEDEIRGRFAFEAHPLDPVRTGRWQEVRPVAQAFAHIDAWVSAVGASIALTDADASGHSDDVCLVDPRADTATVRPVPGTGDRYEPLALEPVGLPMTGEIAPTGCLPGDFNEDGRTDFLVHYWGRSPVLFLRNDEPGLSARSFAPQDLLDEPELWATMNAITTDLDGDGHLDLVIGNYFPDDVDLLGQSSDPARAHTAMPRSLSDAGNGGRNRVLRWAGTEQPQPGGPLSVRFVDEPDALTPRQARGWTLALGAHDLTGDHLPELYIANDFGRDFLLRNVSTPGNIRLEAVVGRRGPGKPHSKVLGRGSFKGMGIDFADMDGDGRTDLFVSNLTARYGLMETHFAWIHTGDEDAWARGVAPYEERSERLGVARTGWAWDAKFGDFDNDGTPELVQANGFLRGDERSVWPQLQELGSMNDELLPNVANWPSFRHGVDISGRDTDAFFVRDDAGRWHDIAEIVEVGSRAVGRGIATGDVDGDGRLDLIVANQWDEAVAYRNTCVDCGDALALRLLLPADAAGSKAQVIEAAAPGVAGSPAVGARATVTLEDGRVITQQVDGGNGHSGARAPELHFGLGDHRADAQVALTWRDRRGEMHQAVLELAPGRHTVLLGEGSGR